MASACFPVFGRVEGDRLLLDLRTVIPRHDSAIVRALFADKSGESNETSAVGDAQPR
jgi:hypothetical protein